MEHIGFVGVGRMGANMARRLHDQGHRITAVQDRDLQSRKPLRVNSAARWHRRRRAWLRCRK